MGKLNCWEFKGCGREPGGRNAHEYGVCPASTEPVFDGTNSGKNSGRACWVVAGTFCGGRVQGTYAEKMGSCMKCEFQHLVSAEEHPDFTFTTQLLKRLNEAHAKRR